MKRLVQWSFFGVLLCSPLLGRAQNPSGVDIPYEKFVLDNGLTVLVHEDHKAPIVAVNIWYHVGSKNEPAGNSGFAHLFEHLMFNGSEHYDDDYFKVMERIGATDLNGTTNEDRTNYFQNVPKTSIDVALWMESDRMGHLLGAISQEKLDEQRGVVQNEKRQGENQPYSRVWDLIPVATYPAGHPYAHTVIGSMEDLNAASLDDVKEWFRTYYGPNNAVLVIAGDVDVATAKEKAQAFFGDIPPGPPIAKHETWIAKRTGVQRELMQDRVPQARIYKVWNVPEFGAEEEILLEMFSDVLSSGKNSRLYKRLVYDDQIATDAYSYVDAKEIAGQFMMVATARPGEDLSKVEKALDEEFARLLVEGPTTEELERVKTSRRKDQIWGMERIGGFGGKSDLLAMNQVYQGSPDDYKRARAIEAAATPASIQKAAQKWLSDGVYILEVHPFPELKEVASNVDRSAVPESGVAPQVDFTKPQRATLSNGMKVVLGERHNIPGVTFALMLDAGYAADQFAAPGTASLAMNLLDEGTKTRSALEINKELYQLGAGLGSYSDLDVSYVTMDALKQNLEASLDLYTDVILNPAFPEEELQRLKKDQLARIQREKVTPIQMALRVFPKLLYGENHAYGLPLTGSGTESSVNALKRDDLARFHTTWFKPNNATLVVVGDVTMNELKPLLEKKFGAWKKGETPKKNLAKVELSKKQAVYLVDRPGSQQSIIIAGHVAPPTGNPNEIAIQTMNNVLGGSFTSRINMNLREDKHWSYGAQTLLWDASGQRPFLVYAPVQADKTKESMQEIAGELKGIVGDKPVSADELDKVQRNQTLSLAGRWETMGSVGGSLQEIVRFGLSDTYFDTYDEQVKNLKLPQISSAAKEVVHPDNLVWVVVGDREKIEAGIRELGFGEIHLMDADGNLIGATGTK